MCAVACQRSPAALHVQLSTLLAFNAIDAARWLIANCVVFYESVALGSCACQPCSAGTLAHRSAGRPAWALLCACAWLFSCALFERNTCTAASHTLTLPRPHGRRSPRGRGPEPTAALQQRHSRASRPDPAAAAPQLLGLKGRESYLDPQILAAYEGLLAAPLEPGFSEGAGEGRAFLLQAAADELRRTRGRAPPGEARGIYVEWALLPGALALLQEARPRRGAAPKYCGTT